MCVAKEIKKYVHLEELFTDLLKVVYKVAQLTIQVPNIDTWIQYIFFEKFKAHNVSIFDMTYKHDINFYRLN